MVGRSKDTLGPYVDTSGKPMMDGGGHVAILRDADKDYVVYHAYDAHHDGRPTLRIAPLGWTDDNWPAAFV